MTAGGTNPPSSLPTTVRGVAEGDTQNPIGADNFVVQGVVENPCSSLRALSPLQIGRLIWVS